MNAHPYRWLVHVDEWQGRPAHVFVDGNGRSLCKRADRPPVPLQVWGDGAALCQVCTAALENALDMTEVRS